MGGFLVDRRRLTVICGSEIHRLGVLTRLRGGLADCGISDRLGRCVGDVQGAQGGLAVLVYYV